MRVNLFDKEIKEIKRKTQTYSFLSPDLLIFLFKMYF